MLTRHTTLLRLLLAILIGGQMLLGAQDAAAKALPLVLDQFVALADDGPDGDGFDGRPAVTVVVSPRLVSTRSEHLAASLPATPTGDAHHWATGPPLR
jgi:hypothetical protein